MVKIGLIGLGTVGSGVVQIDQKNHALLTRNCSTDLQLTTLCDLDFNSCSHDLSGYKKTSNWRELISDPEVDIIIELIGGENPAKTIIEEALKAGKHVVTANKLVLAKYGRQLLDLANEHHVSLLFEAAVAGAIPIIGPLRTTLLPNQIEGIFGIMNGTTNYILTKMQQQGADFTAVLKEAQHLGYAEADPTSDVGGYDSMYKLCVLVAAAFQAVVKPEDVLLEGITQISSQDIDYVKKLGSVIKLVAMARLRNGMLELRVHPVILGEGHPLASVNGVFNAVYVQSDCADDLMFYGRGAGGLPTASSVWSDVMAIANKTPYRINALTEIPILPKDEIESEYYFRFRVQDQPGVLAEISGIFAAQQISIKQALQIGLADEAELVIVSHTVKEKNKNAAVKAISALKCVKDVSSIIRVGI